MKPFIKYLCWPCADALVGAGLSVEETGAAGKNDICEGCHQKHYIVPYLVQEAEHGKQL